MVFYLDKIGTSLRFLHKVSEKKGGGKVSEKKGGGKINHINDLRTFSAKKKEDPFAGKIAA